MELTDELKNLLIDTAKQLKGSARLPFVKMRFLDTLSVPACCTEHKASSTLLHLPFVDARGQER